MAEEALERMWSMSQGKILLGVIRYEFLMQVRRRSLWIVFGGITLILLNGALGSLRDAQRYDSLPLIQLMASLTVDINWLSMIVIGVFLADRFPRDKASKVDELFESTVGTVNTRLVGKYLGSMLASLLPAFLIYFLVVVLLAFYKHSVLILPISLLTYTVIVLPGICFITAFTLACTSLMWVPLYQFLFIGYCFWGNMLGPQTGLPTLAGSILTPSGSIIGAGFFGSVSIAWIKGISPLESLASVSSLLLIPLLVMILFYYYLRWEQARK